MRVMGGNRGRDTTARWRYRNPYSRWVGATFHLLQNNVRLRRSPRRSPGRSLQTQSADTVCRHSLGQSYMSAAVWAQRGSRVRKEVRPVVDLGLRHLSLGSARRTHGTGGLKIWQNTGRFWNQARRSRCSCFTRNQPRGLIGQRPFSVKQRYLAFLIQSHDTDPRVAPISKRY